MLNLRTISYIRRAGSLKTVVLGLLVTCMLLSTCAVRKSIEAFLQGSARTESGIGNGFKKIRARANGVEPGNPLLCSPSERNAAETAGFRASKSLDSLLPQTLFLATLFGIIGSALLALLHGSASTSFSKTSFAYASAPIYIKNRLLLI